MDARHRSCLDRVVIHWPGAWLPEQKAWGAREWMSGRAQAMAQLRPERVGEVERRQQREVARCAAAGVVQRLIELTGTYDSIVKASKEGESDPMREWFDDSYSMGILLLARTT